MNRYRITFSLFLIVFCLRALAIEFRQIDSVGKLIIHYYTTAHYDSIYRLYDSTAQQYYKPEILERDWRELTGTYGAFLSGKAVTYEEGSGYYSIGYEMKFAYLPYLLGINFNDKFKILYLSYMPAHKAYMPPAYSDISKFHELDIPFGAEPYPMNGTLSLPNGAGKKPLVMIIGEAGPTDKDFTFGLNRPYKDLAWGIASAGYAVFRYDKRSARYGMNLLMEKKNYVSFTCREEYLNDLYAAIDSLKKRKDIDTTHIYLLGHGQGGILPPLVVRERRDIHGIIMMGANALKTQEMMIEQYAYLSKVTPNKKPEYEEQARKAKFSMRKDLYEFELFDSMPYGVQPSYWIWLNKYDHVTMTKQLLVPTLILHAERDYQVSMKNLQMWKDSLKDNPNITIKSYPKLNHLFYEGVGESTYSEYFIRSNVAAYVDEDIVAWLKEH